MARNQDDGIEVRQMLYEEIEPALKLFSGFGLNDSLSVTQSYYLTSPKQFYVAVQEGQRSAQVVAACASPFTTQDSAFLGLYVVDKNFQGKGIGVKVFDACLNSLNGSNCGLSAVPSKYAIYKDKAGFKIDGGSSLMSFVHKPIQLDLLPSFNSDSTVAGRPLALKIGLDIEKEQAHFDRIVAYDESVHHFCRRDLLRNSLTHSDTKFISISDCETSEILGYGLIHPDITGASMPGPVYAVNDDVGRWIVRALFETETQHGRNAQSGNIAVYCNSEAPYGMKLWTETFKFEVEAKCRKLYTQFAPKFDYSPMFVCHSPDFSC